MVRGTAAQSTSNEIREKVTSLEAQIADLKTDLQLVKRATVKIDDRAPRPQT